MSYAHSVVLTKLKTESSDDVIIEVTSRFGDVDGARRTFEAFAAACKSHG
jgi:hypothetical protein